MAGFVLLAVLMRPIGGWLSDRIGPVPVLAGRFAVVAVRRRRPGLTPGLMPVGTIAFLAMAAALGAGSGATFALVALVAPAEQGRLGHRRGRRRRRAGRLRAAAGDGLVLRRTGSYGSAGPARRRRRRDAAAHRDRGPVRGQAPCRSRGGEGGGTGRAAGAPAPGTH